MSTTPDQKKLYNMLATMSIGSALNLLHLGANILNICDKGDSYNLDLIHGMPADTYNLNGNSGAASASTARNTASDTARDTVDLITKQETLRSCSIKLAEDYFNQCVHAYINKTDKEFVEFIDTAMLINLKYKNHPMDIIQSLVFMTLDILETINLDLSSIKQLIISAKRDATNLIVSRSSKAINLIGCDDSHVHSPIEPNEKIFEFQCDVVK